MILQKTLQKPVAITGIGLHSGRPVSMKLLPAKANTGIFFCRDDLSSKPLFRASAALVNDTRLCTSMQYKGCRVATIEHIMSALAGLGVDNVEIHLDTAEVPIVDGSAAPFVYLIQDAGLASQDAIKKFIFIKQAVEIRDGDKWAKLQPYDRGFKLDFSIDFAHPIIRKCHNTASLNLTTQNYIQEISRARTFGFLDDMEVLRHNQLALGGSLENAVVLDEFRVLNEKGLRYDNEFVRHKMLDAIGDLYLEGYAIVGHFISHKTGHALNNQLFRKLLADSSAYEISPWNKSIAESTSPQKNSGLSTSHIF